MGWVRRHPELVLIAGFALVVIVGIIWYQTRPAPSGDIAAIPTDLPSAAAPSSAPAVAPAVAPASSAAASSAPTAVVSDVPAFDLTGSGDACRMHYFQDDQGRTVTLFDLSEDGELITHVSGPDGTVRHDEQFTRGVNRIVYDFPLSQATDMGAVLYLGDGTQQSCTISAGADAP